MKKLLIVLAAMLALAGCETETKTVVDRQLMKFTFSYFTLSNNRVRLVATDQNGRVWEWEEGSCTINTYKVGDTAEFVVRTIQIENSDDPNKNRIYKEVVFCR